MNSDRYVLTQVLDRIHWQTLTRLAARYNIRTRHFGCQQQLICLGFAQLTWRESLRDIEECLNAKCAAALYHLGLREPVARVMPPEANEQHDWRLWQDLATGLIKRARRLYTGDDLGLDLAPFRDLSRTLKRHLDGVLAYMETKLTNGVMEATNGLLQLAKRIAHGFRNIHYFRLAP